MSMPRYKTIDQRIQESVKRINNSGLSQVCMQLLRSVFSCFHDQKTLFNFSKNILAFALKVTLHKDDRKLKSFLGGYSEISL